MLIEFCCFIRCGLDFLWSGTKRTPYNTLQFSSRWKLLFVRISWMLLFLFCILIHSFLQPHFFICLPNIDATGQTSRLGKCARFSSCDSAFHLLPHGLQFVVWLNECGLGEFSLQLFQLLFPPLVGIRIVLAIVVVAAAALMVVACKSSAAPSMTTCVRRRRRRACCGRNYWKDRTVLPESILRIPTEALRLPKRRGEANYLGGIPTRNVQIRYKSQLWSQSSRGHDVVTCCQSAQSRTGESLICRRSVFCIVLLLLPYERCYNVHL